MIASQQQKRMFFALANQLGYDPEVVKERAKKHFQLDTFKNATTDQLTYLIDKLLEKQMEKEVK